MTCSQAVRVHCVLWLFLGQMCLTLSQRSWPKNRCFLILSLLDCSGWNYWILAEGNKVKKKKQSHVYLITDWLNAPNWWHPSPPSLTPLVLICSPPKVPGNIMRCNPLVGMQHFTGLVLESRETHLSLQVFSCSSSVSLCSILRN